MELGFNKDFYRIDERTVLEHSMALFLEDDDCEQIVVVTDPAMYLRHIGPDGKVVLAAGGETRQESVFNGLKAVVSGTVFIHDGARPYLSKQDLEAVKQAMETWDAACLAVPSKDTVKIVHDGCIVSTPERSTVYNAQTPQAFRTVLLRRCMAEAVRDGYTGTDDCSVVERYSDVPVHIVSGSYENIKLTTPEDLRNRS